MQNGEGHFGAVFHKRGLRKFSQRGWNRGRYLELSSLANKRGMEAFFYSSLEIVSFHFEIKRSLISYKVLCSTFFQES